MYKIGNLTVEFDTRKKLNPLEPSATKSPVYIYDTEEGGFVSRFYNESYVADYTHREQFTRSTVCIKDSDGMQLCRLVLVAAREFEPSTGRWNCNLPDGKLLLLFKIYGFVERVKQAIQECLDLTNPRPNIMELPPDVLVPETIPVRSF